METLSLHEASPGHHFQVSIAQELTGLPRFRRFEGNVAYEEGWALYSESLGRELGLFTDPMQWYGRLSDEMLRAMRLVVDTGLHAKGWTREQAMAYMHENSSLADSEIEAEVERYIVYPGQALGYKVGELRIQALRRRAAAALGDRFDLREFHTQVLEDGALPMDVLEEKIGRWIEKQQSPGGGSAGSAKDGVIRDGAGRNRDCPPAIDLGGGREPGAALGGGPKDRYRRAAAALGAHRIRHQHFAVVRNPVLAGIASHGTQLNPGDNEKPFHDCRQLLTFFARPPTNFVRRRLPSVASWRALGRAGTLARSGRRPHSLARGPARLSRACGRAGWRASECPFF